jgi:hypothetical protein
MTSSGSGGLGEEELAQEHARDEEYYRDGPEAPDEFKPETANAQPIGSAETRSQSNTLEILP